MSVSPLLSVHRDFTPPVMPDMAYIHDRLTYLVSQIHEIRSVILTEDGYVERRNREDKHIRRELDAERTISDRIDTSVTALRKEVNQIKTEIIHIKNSISNIASNIDPLSHNIKILHKDVDRLERNFDLMQEDLKFLRTESEGLRCELEALRTEVRLRFDMLKIESDQMNRVRFNSLATLPNAPITAPPKIGDDGAFLYPDHVPRFVWQFWYLKKGNRINHLVKLAEFYEVQGYEYWHQSHVPDDDWESLSDEPNNLTLTEATYKYPDSCHQALAAVFGLNYGKIQKNFRKGPSKRPSDGYGAGSEGREGPDARISRVLKRPLEDTEPIAHATSKAVKMMSAYQYSASFKERLVAAAPSRGRKSPSLEEQKSYVYWREPSPSLSDKAIENIKNSKDPEAIIYGIDHGILHVKDDPRYYVPPKEAVAREEDTCTIPTVPISSEGALPPTT